MCTTIQYLVSQEYSNVTIIRTEHFLNRLIEMLAFLSNFYGTFSSTKLLFPWLLLQANLLLDKIFHVKRLCPVIHTHWFLRIFFCLQTIYLYKNYCYWCKCLLQVMSNLCKLQIPCILSKHFWFCKIRRSDFTNKKKYKLGR